MKILVAKLAMLGALCDYGRPRLNSRVYFLTAISFLFENPTKRNVLFRKHVHNELAFIFDEGNKLDYDKEFIFQVSLKSLDYKRNSAF